MTAGSRSIAIVLALVATARAQTPSADAAFKRGRELFKAGNYAQACPQFELSQSLDPQNGTLFNIAECDERIGKLASALTAYRELAGHDKNATREALTSAAIAKLERRVAKLSVQVAGKRPGLVISLDRNGGSRKIDRDVAVEIDPGDYTVAVHADGFRNFSGPVSVTEEGSKTNVAVTLIPESAPQTDDSPVVTVVRSEREAPASPRKRIGVAITAIGGVAVVGGLVLGALARSKWNDAMSICGSMTCATSTQAAQANALGDKAQTYATLATAFAIGGAVTAATGIALWLTAPHEHAVQLVPQASGNAVGVTLSGAF